MDDSPAPPPPSIDGEPSGEPASRRRRTLVVVGAVAAVAAAVAAALLALVGVLRGSGEVADRMVPGDVAVYATADLDPALSQKLDLQALVQHVPALRGRQLDGRADQAMDTLLRPEGLSFARDVRPWLGSEVALAARLTGGTPSVLIVASRDDARAAAALARIRRTGTGSHDVWSEHVHGGVTVSIGVPAGARGASLAYALLDHAAVLGTSEAMVDDVIDTDQGRRPSLRATGAYTAALQRLPADRVGLAYASGPQVGRALREALSGADLLPDMGVGSALGQGADAVRSAALALSAQHGGIAADLAVVTDASRLSPAARRTLQATATANPALDWVPADVTGVLAAGGLRDLVQALVHGTGAGAETTAASLAVPLPDLGVDPAAALSHLDGDLALEVRTTPGSVPGGALVAGADDEQAVRTLLSRLMSVLAGPAWPQTETDGGTTITSVTVAGLGAGVAPAFAVVDGMAILGSSPAEVRAAIDAHATGRRVATAPGFSAGGAPATGGPVLYVDLQRVRAAVEAALPAGVRPWYQRELGPNLASLRSLRVTRQGTGAGVTLRLFLAAG